MLPKSLLVCFLLVLSVSCDAVLQSDTIFEFLRGYFATGEAEPLIAQVSAVYQFEVLNVFRGSVVKRWVVDLKNGKGAVKDGIINNPDADVTWFITDEALFRIFMGSLSPTMATLQARKTQT